MQQVWINLGLNNHRVQSLISAIRWVIAETKLRTQQSLSPKEKINFTFRWSLVSVHILDSAMDSAKD